MLDKKALRDLSYGLYIITATSKDGRKVGCIANTFQQVASEPLAVSVSLNKENATTQAICETGKFAASVLSEEATMDLIGPFGFKCSQDVDKFAEVEHRLCEAGIPFVTSGCLASFSAEVHDQVDVGSHILFVGRVTEAEKLAKGTPMTYAYYHEVLRGKTPPKAVSYVEETTGSADQSEAAEANTSKEATGEGTAPKYGWRCKLCGYIEMMDELPDDYTCPICGVGKDMFERVEL